jgi:hypothetical protein
MHTCVDMYMHVCIYLVAHADGDRVGALHIRANECARTDALGIRKHIGAYTQVRRQFSPALIAD